MKTLLRLAEWCCGPALRASVFEPLVADWHRERRETAAAGTAVRAIIAARWSLGFLAALAGCAVRHAGTTDAPMWKYGLVVFTLAIAVAIAAETAIIRFTAVPDYTLDMLLLAALMRTGVATLAAGMLPAMFLLRRRPNAGARTAAIAITMGAVLIAAAEIAQGPLANYTPTFWQTERMHQRMLANDRAGKIQYPGTVYRELRQSTLAQRRAQYENYRVQRERVLAARPLPTPWQRLRRSTAPLMVVVFGVMGWALGGLRRPTVSAAVGWWLAAWLVSLIVEGRVPDVLGLPYSRPAWWVFPVLASIAALSLLIAARARRGTTSPHNTQGT